MIGALDRAGWLSLDSFFSGGSPKTPAVDESVLQARTPLFALAGAPALLPAWREKAPHAALLLALAFPVVILSLSPAPS